jgi:ankyrin repeat protein
MSILTCSEATPLFIAAHLGCGEIIKHLLSTGCDPKAKCNVQCRRSVGKVSLIKEEVFRRDFSPVQAACLAGRETIVRQLLEAGAASQEVAETCLIFGQQLWDGLLVAVAVDNSECAVALLDHGVQIRVDVLRWILEDGKVDIMCTLVDYGIPMAVAAMTLKTMLSQNNPWVLEQKSEKCLRSLILGVEGIASYIWGPDSATKGFTEDGTLLHILKADSSIVAALLIEGGASTDARNSKGETPLMLAAQKGNHLVVEVLLANGASQHAQNNKGRSAVQYALDTGNRKVIERFFRPVHDPT